jgi:hypothetical protein
MATRTSDSRRGRRGAGDQAIADSNAYRHDDMGLKGFTDPRVVSGNAERIPRCAPRAGWCRGAGVSQAPTRFDEGRLGGSRRRTSC